MGRIINIEQNTVEWHNWRNTGLGASDAPIIMRVSPWTSQFQLWSYKVGLMIREESNYYAKAAMERGHKLEPIVRSKYEAQSGYLFPATSFEHDIHPFLHSSLDGYNRELNTNLEIKCPGKIDHALAVSGKVPDKYYPQLQAQMLISGATETKYASWDGVSADIVVINVEKDFKYQANLLMEMLDFWELIQTKTPPNITMKDLKYFINYIRKEEQNSFKIDLANKDEEGYIKVS